MDAALRDDPRDAPIFFETSTAKESRTFYLALNFRRIDAHDKCTVEAKVRSIIVRSLTSADISVGRVKICFPTLAAWHKPASSLVNASTYARGGSFHEITLPYRKETEMTSSAE